MPSALSEPYLSEVAFCRSPTDFPKINVEENAASRVLRCACCHVVVHARCYGLPDLETCHNRADLESWICDACNSPALQARPRCCLCPIRGGALKRLENSSLDGQSFWVHLACAIAVGKRCRFVDVVRRRPLLLRSELQSTSLLPPPSSPNQPSASNGSSCQSISDPLRIGTSFSDGKPSPRTSVRQLYRDAYVWEPLKRHSAVGATASTSTDMCEVCSLPAPGGPADLPLVACWHEDCPGRVHLTCAQLSGYLIATGRYPHCLYVACRRHPAEYREVSLS
ncbi:unnamed protein product [Dibothriocephalus latus]|uniref:Zinc finger PHD-type domain-containing protein n=1 Tax=Dibothriocephalus latus TaxID=60516 RepID=A0A3P7NQ24_DIBLA|nr:unnamed protein product [Dibothriocephalus latus]